MLKVAVDGFPQGIVLFVGFCILYLSLKSLFHRGSLEGICCIGDGDTGYGNAVNVKRTVRGYAQAGMAGLWADGWWIQDGRIRGSMIPIDFYQRSSQKLQHLYSAILHIICGILDAELIAMVALTPPGISRYDLSDINIFSSTRSFRMKGVQVIQDHRKKSIFFSESMSL